MNGAHFHLLINHLPILGSFFALLVLLYGMWRDSRETQQAAFGIFILSALGAMMANASGEEAEEVVENISGIAKQAMDAHEDAAALPLYTLILAGVLSLLALFFRERLGAYFTKVRLAILVLGLIGFLGAAYAGWQGGQIRHTELSGASAQMPGDTGGEAGEGEEE